jgi:hypothetical protein
MRLLVLLLAALPAWAADEITVYDLLAPATHAFDIIYDVTATREGAPYFFNPIRAGSVATKESVIDRLTGKLLPALLCGQFHRAGQDREIRYLLLDPAASVPHLARFHHHARGTEIGAQLRTQRQHGQRRREDVQPGHRRAAARQERQRQIGERAGLLSHPHGGR